MSELVNRSRGTGARPWLVAWLVPVLVGLAACQAPEADQPAQEEASADEDATPADEDPTVDEASEDPEAAEPGTVIQDVQLVDGTGAPARPASVRIVQDLVAEVASPEDLEPGPADSVVEGEGRVLAPGFIDTHSHHDEGLRGHGDALAAVSQGITTIVVGQDGSSNLPVSKFFEGLEKDPPAVNVASFTGHSTLRRKVMENRFQPANPEELEAMGEILREELEAGSLGLSTGLEYVSGIYADTDELVALARVVSEHGGRYATHMRSEDRRLEEAIGETLEVGRRAEVPVHISHFKLGMAGLWGEAGRFLDMLDEARAEGIEVTADVYPYTFWQSNMSLLFSGMDPEDPDAARTVLEKLVPAEDIRITRYEPEPKLEGRTIAQVADTQELEPADALVDLVKRTRKEDPPLAHGVQAEAMDEGDVARLLTWEHTNVASDGGLMGAHPRGFGTYPRVLSRFVRQRGDLELEEAIHKMTGLAAENAGLANRGVVEPGAPVDLVLLDPEVVEDRATPGSPHQVAKGIDRVWVAGEVVYTGDGETTGSRPGQVLRGTGVEGYAAGTQAPGREGLALRVGAAEALRGALD